MKKLPFLILLAVLSGMHISACAEEDAGKKDAIAETKPATGGESAAPAADAKPAEGEQAAAADTKPAEGEQAAAPATDGEKKSGGGDEPDCN